MRAVFLGTPAAAVPSLESVARVAELTLVVTRPDAARGRSGKAVAPPVKAAAAERGIPVVQPGASSAIADLLVEHGPFDVAVLVAFGMLIRPEALAVPKAGFVNVHFSVLPRWRGAAPVQRAVMAGDKRTGVTLMRLDAGLDTGPVLATGTTAIGESETAASLTYRLAGMGGRLLEEWLTRIVVGTAVPVEQDPKEALTAAKLSSDERWFDLDRSASDVLAAIRGLTPWPGAWIIDAGRGVRIHAAGPHPPRDGIAVGEVRSVDGRIALGVGDGLVELLEVQPEGRARMTAGDWMRGRRPEGVR